MRRRRAPPAILLVERTTVTDGQAARPDTPSSPCQRSKTLPRALTLEANTASPDRMAQILWRRSWCPLLHQAALAVARATAAAARDNARSALRDGGGERNRTDDLLLAKQALSQLSYTPKVLGGPPPKTLGGVSGALAPREPHRAELTPSQHSMPARCRAGRALFWSPLLHQAASGATPLRLSRLATMRGAHGAWWAREDLNLRPHAYQARALTN
jgi:hypothetical protein